MIWFVGFVLTVIGANWLLETYGIVPVGFGLSAPAGVFAAGLSFTLRDLLNESKGRGWVVAAIAAGALVSLLISPAFAVASAVAFAVSELADFAVYAPLRRRHWVGAVALSNTAGAVVDSLLFLWLAFGSFAFWEGQVLAKTYMTALAVVVLWVVRQYWWNREERYAVVG